VALVIHRYGVEEPVRHRVVLPVARKLHLEVHEEQEEGMSFAVEHEYDN
jgi:hypothetical protein